jgi:hypothetical protein
MYANAALIRPNYQPGQYNSGGPLPHSIDVYRAGAPDLDFVAPDIYFDDFVDWVSQYKRTGNPVFVPEARGGSTGAANALYAFGKLDAIGFSPFGIDGTMSFPETEKLETVQKPIASVYAELSHLAPLILKRQGTGKMGAMVLEGEAQRAGEFELGGFRMTLTRAKASSGSDDRVAVLFIQTGDGEFEVAAAGEGQVAFSPATDGLANAGIVSIDEEVLADGQWSLRRRLNGDENGQGQVLRIHSDVGEAIIYHLRLYRY